MSLGGKHVSETSKKAVEAAWKAGIPIIAAAGNKDMDACEVSPAYVKQTITVGAVDKEDTKTDFSNYGKCLDIWAPGVDIVSAFADADDDYKGGTFGTGTSMAAPQVTGAAAII